MRDASPRCKIARKFCLESLLGLKCGMWSMDIITINLDIFTVNNNSQLAQRTKIKHAKYFLQRIIKTLQLQRIIKTYGRNHIA